MTSPSDLRVSRQLRILVACAVLPSLGIILYSGLFFRKHAIDDARGKIEDISRGIAHLQQEKAEQAKILLHTLSILPEVKNFESEKCNDLFRQLRKTHPEFANIVLMDAQGFPQAAALPFQGVMNFSDRASFQDAVRTREFSAGDYVFSRMAKVSVFQFAFPLVGDSGELTGVLFATLDLGQYSLYFNGFGLPPNSRTILTDRNGVRLFTIGLESESAQVGTKIREENWRTINESPDDQGFFNSLRYDGVECVFHFIKLRLRPGDPPYMVILTNIPQATALAKAEAAFTLNLCLLTVAAILALVIARFLGKAIVGRHVEALKESEERFRNLFENAPLAYQSLDENGRFLDVNHKWLESLGYKDKNQVLGRWFGDILAPGDQEHFGLNFPMFKHACVIDGVEFEMLRTDGGRITVSFNGRVQTDCDGHFMRTHCIFTDITERNRIEEVKQKEHFINQTIIESVPGTFYMLDKKGHYVRWNAYQRDVIVGKPDDQVATVNALDTIHPDDRSLVGAKIEAVLKNGSEEILEGRVLLHSGPAYQWMLMTGRQVIIQGNPFLIGFGIDITARKEAEASLNAIKWLVDKEVRPVLAHEASGYGDLVQLNKSRVILNAVGSDILANMVHDYMTILGTSSAVYEKNGDYAFGIFASGWCQTMDQASRRLCGCTNNTEALVSGKWLCHESCWSEASLTAMETRQPADIACKGGIRLYAVPIKSGDEVVGAINFGYGTPPRDKTVIAELAARYQVDPDELWKLSMEYEHRPDFIIDTAKQRLKTTARLIGEMVSRSMVEQDLQKATHLAETANRAKSEFLANMSHEIRTPLNGILGMLQLLQTTDPNDEQKEYLFGAIRSTNRLTRLLSDILDISRIEAGRMEVVEVEFNIKKTRDSIKELFNPEAKGKGVRLEFGRDDDLPLLLIGDEARLRQILFNLVGNAIKFTEKGEIRVDASLLPNLSDSSVRVLVTVSDTGIGIPEESLKSVFEPFVQAEGSYTRRFQGAGLGLSIVRRLVKLLGGDLSIDSTVGEGTTVYLSLPFKLPSGGQGQIDQEVRVIAPVADASWRILIAEDDSVSLITAKRMLEKSGYSVTAAKDGQEALQRLTEEDFDLILMDVQMPVMDGVEATKAIRGASNLGAKSSVPIVAMTAYAMTGDKESFLAAGMDDYISKPVDKAALVDVIERVLSLKRNIQ